MALQYEVLHASNWVEQTGLIQTFVLVEQSVYTYVTLH